MASLLESNAGDAATNALKGDAAYEEWDPFADPADTEPCRHGVNARSSDVISKILSRPKPDTWDPFADPTDQEAEKERLAQAAEAQAKAETEAFRAELELELEVMARSRMEESDRAVIRGVAVQVKYSAPKTPEDKAAVLFGEAFCRAISSIEGLLSWDSAVAGTVIYFMDARWNPICALMQTLMHLRFWPDAHSHFQEFIELFVMPSTGLQDVVGQCLKEDPSSPSNALGELFAQLNELLTELLKSTRRIVELLASPGLDVSRDFFRRLWTLSKVLEQSPLDIVLPDVSEEDAVSVVLRPVGPSQQWIPLRVRWDLTAEQLKDMLVRRLLQPRDLRMFREEGSGASQPVPLRGQCLAVGPGSQHIMVHGMQEVSDDDSATQRLQKPILKVTVMSSTRLLVELRTRYQEPDFYREYHELRKAVKPGGEALHIAKALSVQSVVLPRFGFDGTIRGVMEMRNQVSALAELDGPLKKALKDIHKLLDAHQDLPKMPIVRVIESPRIELEDTTEWIAHLANEGFAVIKGIADESQVKTAYNLLWDFLEEADVGSVVNRHDVNTWAGPGRDGHGWAGAADDGIIQGRGIGQSEVLWFLRGLPTVRKAFEKLWGTERLVSSFDGAGVFRPYGIHREWKISKKNWYHLDQAHYKRGLHCVQGLVTLKDATQETGGLVVVPRSHRFHNDICSHYKAGDLTSDFLGIRVDDKVLTEGDLGPRMVAAKAGDLILWDSRTVHCNTAPLKENHELLEGDDLLRAVCYICMTPAAWCSEETLRQRQAGFKDGATTAHWPHEYHPKNVPKTCRPCIKLSDEQQRLICPSGESPSGTDAESGIKPGAISFLPRRRLKVVRDGASLRRSPTTEWGSPAGSLARGELVEGYAVGGWLRLTSWSPRAGRPHPLRHADEEVWASSVDFEACAELDG